MQGCDSFVHLLNRRSIYVKGFDRHIESGIIKAVLEDIAPAGQVKVVVPIDHKDGCSFGYAYVNFLSAHAEEEGGRLMRLAYLLTPVCDNGFTGPCRYGSMFASQRRLQ